MTIEYQNRVREILTETEIGDNDPMPRDTILEIIITAANAIRLFIRLNLQRTYSCHSTTSKSNTKKRDIRQIPISQNN